MSQAREARLNERAAIPPARERPFWMVDSTTTFFAGPLGYNAPHQHGAPVFLSGLHASFGLRLEGGGWMTCRSAMIPAGVSHELDVGGQPIGVLYIEGDRGDTLAGLVAGAQETAGVLVGQGSQPLFREIFENQASGGWAGEALGDLLRMVRRRRRRTIDARVARSLDLLAGSDATTLSASCCARRFGLSLSHFQHLFTAEVGVPFRRYRAWLRMRDAIAAVVDGENFTGAAHTAGFADQAHFARDFRRTFGAPASLSLHHPRR